MYRFNKTTQSSSKQKVIKIRTLDFPASFCTAARPERADRVISVATSRKSRGTKHTQLDQTQRL